MASVLADGLHAVPPGKIAAIVTHLEMTKPAVMPQAVFPGGITLTHEPDISTDSYRDLFHAVGSDWLWFSRLRMNDANLSTILRDPKVEVFVLRDGETRIGILELDFRTSGQCELAFFGLVSGAVGKGLGRALLQAGIAQAFGGEHEIMRLTVHTCTLDHPKALGFYRAGGFMPVRQEVEIAIDPRLDGSLPETAGPHVPLLKV